MNRNDALALYKRATEAAAVHVEGVSDGGYCGQSAVLINDARQPFVRHLRDAGIGSAGHPGWIVAPDVPRHIQSLDVREAATRSMAAVFESAGIKTHIKIWPD